MANTTIQSLALQSPPSPRGPPPSSSSASTQPPASSTQPSASSTTQPPAPSTQPHSQDIRPAVAAALLQLISHRDPSSSEEEEAQEAQGSRHGAKEPDSSPRPSTAAEEAPVGRGVAAVPQFPKDQDLRFTHSAAR